MAYSDYLSHLQYAPTLPDADQLGNRILMCDGINPNMILDGHEENARIQGVLPDTQPDLNLTPSNGAGTLTNSAVYAYGVQRIVTLGDLVLKSAISIDTLTMGASDDTVAVTLKDYEYKPAAGAVWTVTYRILRSKPENRDLLFLVADLTQAQYDALSSGVYSDITPDANLDTTVSESIAITEPDLYQFNYPTRFVRAWRGHFVTGGSYAYRFGTVDTTASSTTITVNAPGQVRESDVGANLSIDTEFTGFIIESVNTVAGTYTVTNAAVNTSTGSTFGVWRDFDTIYVSNPMPADIESHISTNVVESSSGSGDRITGIATSAGFCYIFRENRIETLEGVNGDFALKPLYDGVGLRSHQTLTDRYNDRFFFYAGEHGVYSMYRGQVQKVSSDIDNLIADEVDHRYDEYTHGVYDPNTKMYHLWLFGSTDVSDYGLRIPHLMLSYDVELNQWYKGELAASTSGLWKDETGALFPYIGIAGGMAKLETNDYDGYNDSGTVTSSANSTIDDTAAAFDTTGPGIAGAPIHVTATDGTIQRRIIKENTATQITIYGTWDTNPSVADAYQVGAIRYDFTTAEEYFPNFEEERLLMETRIISDPVSTSENCTISALGSRSDSTKAPTQVRDLSAGEELNFRPKLRSRSYRIKLEGSGIQQTKFLSIRNIDQDIKRRNP